MIVLQSWEFDGEKRYGHRAGEIASEIASGRGFSWAGDSNYVPDDSIKKTSWEAPVYPFIIAAVFKVFGIYSNTSAVILILFQIILSALCCLLIYLVGKHIFNEWTGLAGSLIFALYPAGIHFSIQKIQTTYLIVVLLLLFILQTYELLKTPTIKECILTGVTVGIAVLTDPTLIGFFLFILIWLLFKGQVGFQSRMIRVAVILMAVAIINLPWQIRNYSEFGEFFLIKSNFSRELFMGNFGNQASIVAERKHMTQLNEGQRNRLYTKKAIDSISNNPGLLVNKVIKRFIAYWTASTKKDIHKGAKIGTRDRIVGLSYLVVLIFGMAGVMLALIKHRKIQVLLLAVALLPIPYYLTWFARFRYRFPIETLMIVFASYTLYCLWDYFNSRTS